ncbi:hypothetical protein QQ045_032890 [Rhodiola kirilowii]
MKMQRAVRRSRDRLQRSIRKRRSLKKKYMAKMEVENLKLCMDNNRIMRENEKLKNKAVLLYEENQELLIQLQNKSSPAAN